jgi:hypothetical protein
MKTDQPQSDSNCVVCSFENWEIEWQQRLQHIKQFAPQVFCCNMNRSIKPTNKPRTDCAGGGQARKGGSDWHWSAL